MAGTIFDELFGPGEDAMGKVVDKSTFTVEGTNPPVVLKPGTDYVCRSGGTAEEAAEAARWLKAHMPGVARPGQKTAQQILREIRAGK